MPFETRRISTDINNKKKRTDKMTTIDLHRIYYDEHSYMYRESIQLSTDVILGLDLRYHL
jgi:hypothetical protein